MRLFPDRTRERSGETTYLMNEKKLRTGSG
jgi:hypothetical protein